MGFSFFVSFFFLESFSFSFYMFRKARNISKKLGIHHNKDHETTSEYETSDDEKHEQPFLVRIDTTGSTHNNTNDNNLDLQLLNTNTNRPALTQCKSAPEDYNNTEENSSNNLTTVLSQPPANQNNLSPRPTHITFALPVTPQRSKSPSAIAYPKARPVRSLSDDELDINQSRRPLSSRSSRPRRSGWRLFHDRDSDEEPVPHNHLPIFVGTRVRLKLRPLPTFGTVKYIGPVHFDTGEYIGVELDYGGNNKM